MIETLAATVPRPLAPHCRAVEIHDGTDGRTSVTGPSIDVAIDAFARGFWQPDPRSLASLWSAYYFNALIVPAAAALLCHDHILPVTLDTFGLALDAKAIPARIVLPHAGRPTTPAERGRRFTTLVDGHLDPFVTLYAARTRLAPRLLWSNAATIFDYVVGTVAGDGVPEVRAEAEAILAGTAGANGAASNLADPFRVRDDDTRERKTCCMRHRLSGVGRCAIVCPMRDAF